VTGCERDDQFTICHVECSRHAVHEQSIIPIRFWHWREQIVGGVEFSTKADANQFINIFDEAG